MATLLIILLVQPALYQAEWESLDANPGLIEPDCLSIPVESICNEESNEWCKWNEIYSFCSTNYDPVLFQSTLEMVTISRSLISFIMLSFCMILYVICGFLTKKLKIFKDISSEKLDKCRIYIFELIGLTLGLSYLLYYNIYNIITNPNKYLNMTPSEALDASRFLAGIMFVLYMYLIEMLTNNLRWSLQLHHVVTITLCLYYMVLMDDFTDLACLRCVLCISLYPFTEHNVFVQLLLYRTYPLSSWKIHLGSSILYVLTRIFIIYLFIWCYYDWAISDEIANQIKGKSDVIHYPYLIFFFALPILNILLNFAQYQTLKALFYLTKSVRKRIKQRNELKKYPRLQELYDIFIEFDREDTGYWTMMDWKKFIFYHSTFIKHDTCIILWNVLGFKYVSEGANLFEQIQQTISKSTNNKEIEQSSDENEPADNIFHVISDDDVQYHSDQDSIDKEAQNMMADENDNKTKELKEQDAIDKEDENESNGYLSTTPIPLETFTSNDIEIVKQIICAQLEVLLQTIFRAQSQFNTVNNDKQRRDTMLQLYFDINSLIGPKQRSIEEQNIEIQIIKKNTQIDDISENIKKTVSNSIDIIDEGLINKQLQFDNLISKNKSNRVSSIINNIPTAGRMVAYNSV